MILRAISFWAIFAISAFILGVFGIVSLLAILPWTKIHYINLCGRFVIKVTSLIFGLKVEVLGQENIPDKPSIFACKHQSAWETAFIPSYIFGSVGPIKRELIYFPFFGIILYFYGMIFVDRSAGMSSLKKLVSGIKARISEGRHIFIFPEGTRVKPGEMMALKPGICAIQRAMPEVPVVPVYLNSGEVWPPKAWLVKSGTITVVFKKPIIGEHSKEELLQKLEKEINSVS